MSAGTFDVVIRTEAKQKKEVAGLVYLLKRYFEGNWDKADAFRLIINEHDPDPGAPAPYDNSAATSAFDAIALLCSIPHWDYPGQLVRDVERLRLAKDTYYAQQKRLAERVVQLDAEITELKEAATFHLCEHCECRRDHPPGCSCTNDE